MFVLSVKPNRRKTVAVLGVLLIAVTAVIVLVSLRSSNAQAESAGKKYSLSAGTNEERVAFFKQFGWDVKEEPISTGDITIPENFSDVYTAYNNIQKEQGLDLMPYAGKTCTQYIYQVTNYPQQDYMRGALLVYNGKVVGGDLSTPQLDGFMTGFDGQVESNDYTLDQPTLARGPLGDLIDNNASGVASSAGSKAPANTASGATASSKTASSKAAPSKAASSKAASSKTAPSKGTSSVEEAKKPASSAIPANAWPTD